MSMTFYGIREARTLIRKLRKQVAGETDQFARGYRTALKDADRVLATRLDELKESAS